MSEERPVEPLVGRVEALMRDSQFAGDHRSASAQKVLDLVLDELERTPVCRLGQCVFRERGIGTCTTHCRWDTR